MLVCVVFRQYLLSMILINRLRVSSYQPRHNCILQDHILQHGEKDPKYCFTTRYTRSLWHGFLRTKIGLRECGFRIGQQSITPFRFPNENHYFAA